MSFILEYKGNIPKIGKNTFIAGNAFVIGSVVIGDGSSIWYGCSVRGDVESISIGCNTNIQDNSVIHVDHRGKKTLIGDNVTVGHMCLLHACTVKSNSFVGMGSIVMDGTIIEEWSMLAAGSLVTKNKIIKTGQLWAGRPAKFVRDLTEDEVIDIKGSAERYSKYALSHINLKRN